MTTCDPIHDDLLALADPSAVPDPLRAHLDGCPACRRWWAGVARLDRVVASLPVPAPPNGKKAAVLARLATAEPVRPEPPRVAHRAAGLLAALAASVVVGVGLWLAVRPVGPRVVVPPSEPPHPFLARVVQRNVALSRAVTPADRLTALGDLADDIWDETRGLARVADGGELANLAGWYDKVVRDGIVKQGESIPPLGMDPASRAALLNGLVARLWDAEHDADRLSREAPPGAVSPLRRMAVTAREGDRRLRELAAGGTVVPVAPKAPSAPGLTAADELHMLRADRALLATLVDTGLDLSRAGSAVDRAARCRETARTLANALRRGDPGRAAELGGQFEVVVRDGLLPALDDARGALPAGSPDAARLIALLDAVRGDLDATRDAIPTADRGRLDGLRERLKKRD